MLLGRWRISPRLIDYIFLLWLVGESHNKLCEWGGWGKWMLGRVQKIKRLLRIKKWSGDFQGNPPTFKTSTCEYGRKGYSQPSLMVLLQWFISAPWRFKFKHEHTGCFWIDVEAIISTVTLSSEPFTKVYEIDHVDGMALDKFVARKT